MFDYLEKLQQAPVAVRRRIRLVLSVVLTALILSGWLVSFTPAIDGEEGFPPSNVVTSPFEELKTNVKQFVVTVALETKRLTALLRGASSTISRPR